MIGRNVERWDTLANKKQLLSAKTADALYALIVQEEAYHPGEKLPNETELSEQLGVSRITLREAVQTLAMQGIVEVRRGRGTFVAENINVYRNDGFQNLQRVHLRLQDLFEARLVFEPQIAAYACERASEAEIEGILAVGRTIETLQNDHPARLKAEEHFHHAIVRASHNDVFVQVMPVITNAIFDIATATKYDEILIKGALQDHEVLMRFLHSRDAQGAKEAMAIHIRHAMSDFKQKG